MEYNAEQIVHGNRMKNEARERPATFATYNGEADVLPNENLASKSKTRKAGPMGQRAMELMTDPVAAESTRRWMQLFGQSVDGAKFNQAAMQQALMGMQ